MRIVRRGTILIRADDAKEAAAMAGRFGYDSFAWDDNCSFYAEVVPNSMEKSVNKSHDKHDGHRNKGKSKKRKHCFFDDDIPF